MKNLIIGGYEIKNIFNEKLDTYERTKSEGSDETELSNSPIRKDPFSTGTITRIRVKSSNVFAIGYNEETGTLQVEFKNGSVYEYYEVPENVFVTFMNAESKGRFIRNLYKYKYREVYK